jgi:hypothetical protein
MNYILYNAFGEQKYISETIYSILSFFHLSNNDLNEIKIVVYTDKVDSFQDVFKGRENIILEDISKDTILNWLNGRSYMPRLKIKSLQHFFGKYNENVLVIDSDTFFIENIDQLFEKIKQNQLIMYSKCTPVNDVLEAYKVYAEYLPKLLLAEYSLYMDVKSNHSISDGNKSYNVDPSFQPFNSGVLGINKSYAHLLSKILSLSDMIEKKYNYWCAEEIAFSIILQSVQAVLVCDGLIYHYANAKFCKYILAYFLNYFHVDDKREFTRLLKVYRLGELENFNLEYKDIPYFSHFIQFHLSPSDIINNTHQRPAPVKSEGSQKGDSNMKDGNTQSVRKLTNIDISKLRPYYAQDSFHSKINDSLYMYRTYNKLWIKQQGLYA